MDNRFFDSSVFDLSPEKWMALAPYLWLALGIALTTVGAALKASRGAMKVLMAAVLAPYAAWLMLSVGQNPQSVFGTSLEVDALTRIVGAAAGTFALVASLFTADFDTDTHSEWGTLLLTSVLGMSLLPGARDFVAFFVYLETLAIAGYMLTSLDTTRERSLEAGLKYLLLGSFASALFLMGATFLYGLAGSFDYHAILERVSTAAGYERTFAVAGAILIVSSLLFKVTVVPFHMWAPDVYQAAPTAMASYMAATTKLTVFASLAGILTYAGLLPLPGVKTFIYTLAIASIVVGSFLAVAQTQVRRMFAYSGVANAGYAALALASGAKATGSLVTFLLIYGATLICSFAVVETFVRNLGKPVHSDLEIRELGAAAKRSPAIVSGLFAFAVFSISSIPPLPGFFGKYLILKDLWNQGMMWGVYALLFGTLLGLAYYLRVLVPVYMSQDVSGDDHAAGATGSAAHGSGLRGSLRPYAARITVVAAVLAAIISVAALGGLSRLPQWVLSVDGFAR